MSQQNHTNESRLATTDLIILIGMIDWQTYQKTPVGKLCLALLPSDTVRHRAQELFLLAFTARMTLFPPFGKTDLDNAIEVPLLNAVWEDYLRSAKGKIVLHGDRYPDTPEEVLDAAKSFFFLGFKLATAKYREIMAK